MIRHHTHGHALGLIFIVALFLLGAILPANAQEEAAPPPQEQAAPQTPGPAVKSPFEGAWPGEKRKIDISLDSMDIYPVLDLVLARILQYNYVVDPAIKGTISLHIQGDYTREGLLNVFNSVLQINGIAVTKGGDDLYKVVRKPDSAKVGTDIARRADVLPHGGDVIRVFQLRYVSSATLVGNLRQILSQGALVLSEPAMNAVIVSDTAENIKKAETIIALMDTDLFRGLEWRLFTLQNVSVEDIGADVQKIFQGKGLAGRTGLDAGGFEVMPLKTLNAILIVTRWSELLDLAATWIAELDQVRPGKGSEIQVYYVQNGKAAEIADLLQQVYGLSRTAKRNKDSKNKKQVLVQGERKPTEEKVQPISEAGAGTGELVGEVDIIPDEVNNALLIRARPRDYASILEVIKKIDILPRQVLIEMLIVDVTLKKDIEYGVEWFIKNKGIKLDGKSYSANVTLDNGITSSVDTPLGKGIPGFAYSLFDSEGGLRSLIHLLASKTDVNILSAPNILAVDNQESSIEVGTDIPTLSGTTVTEGGTTTQSIQYRNAGVILKVTPYVNNNGLVRMEITQESSSIADIDTKGITSPAFLTRKATTYLVAQDGQTIVTGGLMQTQRTKTKTGIPILKDIPVLGHAFGSTGFKNDKTELIFVITPHVIQSREQADALTREFTERVEALKDIISKRPIPSEEESAPILTPLPEETRP